MNAQASKPLSLSSAPSRLSRAQVGDRRIAVPERAGARARGRERERASERASERGSEGARERLRGRETENRMRAESRRCSIACSIFFIGALGLSIAPREKRFNRVRMPRR